MQKQKRSALLAKSRVALGGLLAALMLSAVFAAPGTAATWKFNGEELKGTETILGAAEKSGLTAWGFTTTCDNFLYEVEIWNSGGVGKGSVTDLPLFNCYTSSFCTVEAIEAESFPWPAEVVTTGGNNYMKVKGVDVWILYGGWFCPLWGVWANVTGSAGGLLSNATESATFSPSSFTATGSKLEALGAGVEWNGFFPAEAFETRREQPLSVS
jgi:hypothetical protein